MSQRKCEHLRKAQQALEKARTAEPSERIELLDIARVQATVSQAGALWALVGLFEQRAEVVAIPPGTQLSDHPLFAGLRSPYRQGGDDASAE